MNVQLNLFGPPDITIPKSRKKAYDYLFSITTPDTLAQEVNKISNEFCEQLKIPKDNLTSNSLLSLSSIRYNTPKDNRIVQKLKNALANSETFEIETSGLDFLNYDYSCDLVLKTKQSELISSMFKNLCQEFGMPFMNQSAAAHITIARGISREQKNNIQKEKYSCHSRFECNSITLLRREINPHEAGAYSKVAEIKLN